MTDYKIIDTKERIQADNDAAAATIRSKLLREKTYFINLMGSPGAGKTSVLQNIIRALGDKYSIGVMEADVDDDVDAKTIAATGAKVIQLHTGGLCHMDADMTRRGLEELVVDDLDIVFLENVGNLVCPAEFDTGSNINIMILSVPEGDDKPLKYPLMFKVSNCLLVNKIDTMPVFDFSLPKLRERVLSLNPNIEVFPVSSKDGAGFGAFIEWLDKKVTSWRSE